MVKRLSVITFFFSALFLLLTPGYGQADTNNTMKVALLESPYAEMPLIPLIYEYEKAYFTGIETVAVAAKKYNIEIKYKPFIYGHGPLDILGEIPRVNQWKPDVIIGPSSSDQFLMLRNYLPNIIVLSSYASGYALQTLPSNFHSVFLPDDQIMALLAEYIHKKFPDKNIYVITQLDSKQCVDVSKLFITSLKSTSPTTKIVENKVILDNINSIDSKKLIGDHVNDVILMFTSTDYAYNTLVQHIVADFPGKDFVFFSDQDNWNNEGDNNRARKIQDLPYQSYRISPILFDTTWPEFNEFSKNYYALYQTKPHDVVSYLTYVTLMSVIEALHQFPPPSTYKSMREKILYSYLAALKKNPDWYRARPYGIYQMTSKGEMLVARLPIPHPMNGDKESQK